MHCGDLRPWTHGWSTHLPGNPYDGHILDAQLEQTNILLEDVGVKPTTAIVDLGFRGSVVEASNPGVEIIHRGKFKRLTQLQRDGCAGAKRWNRQLATSKRIMEWIAAGLKEQRETRYTQCYALQVTTCVG